MKVNSSMPRGSAPIIPRGLWPFVRSEHGVGRRSEERGRDIKELTSYN